ncbi:MAG: Gfo/Idh/MocA family oxidoreductase [Acidobacteria bacterium]|nr:Gfo/Idh/MocA family oxidoreductase [Acidobacteriota bacterium]
MVGIGVVGYGYWGPNIVRNFQGARFGSVKCICDTAPKSLERAKQYHPEIKVTTDFDTLLGDPEIDAVAIVTPVQTHYPLARRALMRGKHVFVEKPFTQSTAQAEELIEMAAESQLKIMVDHTFLFTPAVRKIKELIDNDVLGRLYYYDSMRVNLGLFQSDVNVIWDLAAHDLSIMQHILPRKPEAVVAAGQRHVNGVEDVAYIMVYFADNVIAHFNVNWLSPVKVRTTLIGGSKKMLVWNDLEADEKIKVYDKGVSTDDGAGLYDILVSYRMGDVWIPRLEQAEALRLETQYFFECIENDRTPFNDGVAGLRVVQMLEAANASLKNKGGVVYL